MAEKELNPPDNEESFTLEERIVKLLDPTIKENGVVLCFTDFTQVNSYWKN